MIMDKKMITGLLFFSKRLFCKLFPLDLGVSWPGLAVLLPFSSSTEHLLWSRPGAAEDFLLLRQADLGSLELSRRVTSLPDSTLPRLVASLNNFGSNFSTELVSPSDLENKLGEKIMNLSSIHGHLHQGQNILLN